MLTVSTAFDTDEAIAKQQQCFHCGLPVPNTTSLYLTIDKVNKPMCCLGCLAVSEHIHKQGMESFYDFRGSQLPDTSARKVFSEEHCWLPYDTVDAVNKFTKTTDAGLLSARIYVGGMYCTSCAWLIDKALNQLTGVEQVQLNEASRQVNFCWDIKQIKLSKILVTLAKLGYQPRPLANTEMGQGHSLQEKRQALKRLAVAGFGMMQVMTFSVALYLGDFQGMDSSIRQFLVLISMLVSTVVVFYAGQSFFKHAYYGIKNRYLGMDVPVALAIGGAYIGSVVQVFWLGSENITANTHVYFDSAVMFVFFLSLGRFLEMQARHGTLSSTEALRQLLPPLVLIKRNQEEHVITPQEVIIGDRVKVKAGEIVPCDGRILTGNGWFNESILTGESMAEGRTEGQQVIAGTQLVRGEIILVADRPWSQSSIAMIQQLLDKPYFLSAERKSFADFISHYFVGTILVITALVAIFWSFYDPTALFQIILAMLIASCPCAFSLAMPAVNTVASRVLSRQGVLLNNHEVLNNILKVNHWCFDKTGTLSTGMMVVDKIVPLTALSVPDCTIIINYMSQNNADMSLDGLLVNHEHQEGMRNCIDGQCYWLGKLDWVAQECQISALPLIEHTNQLLVLGQMGKLLALVYMEEEKRTDSGSVLGFLKSQGYPLTILSGDRQSSVAEFSAPLPVDNYQGNMQPKDKLQFLSKLQQEQKIIAMVGDGVNDAPVLNSADVSIAMANGSLLSETHADIILLGGRLNGLCAVLKIAKYARHITKQNLFWAIVYNLTVLPLAAVGMLEPWLAALGMSLSSLLVVLNARRLSWLKL